jgi:hypothetical protein
LTVGEALPRIWPSADSRRASGCTEDIEAERAARAEMAESGGLSLS